VAQNTERRNKIKTLERRLARVDTENKFNLKTRPFPKQAGFNMGVMVPTEPSGSSAGFAKAVS
jgi:hypothetical protein